jgi:TDG/mug DNA glycosylase family protein
MIGHQALEPWMGEEWLTLADLWPDTIRAALIGINPAPVSVAAGHYYQGTLGRRIFSRLVDAGVLYPAAVGQYDDDRAVEAGIGFTDIVKRPSPRAADVRREEYRHGRLLLVEKLERAKVPLVIFTFKAAAVAALGKFSGGGFLPRVRLGGAEVFVLPGPMEARDSASRKTADLRSWWAQAGQV